MTEGEMAVYSGRTETKRFSNLETTLDLGFVEWFVRCHDLSWKEEKHDNTVTWLAFWNDPINLKEFKYVFLAASSSLKGQSDKEKYEIARKLKDVIKDLKIDLDRAKGKPPLKDSDGKQKRNLTPEA
ncbi:hypothetical protein LWI28_006594 [Acer negundo]|uniref:DNA topoisomerase I DNA binding eukaryotic-type domain-containing protein n=1 Tax=Acer negundo TaxID=4023 RepID=A0AAD5NUZ9_ACENE|nr:hypothetical protein LWI28_006594 [Acer negundo]